ncbi:MAG: replicative DNA helicase [Gemmatimonadaceae bacterium]|nr:replicative DNA helicase [Gemmatimonadaceae bacterium]NUQ93428.1 replicative DNA helicase [Gemmatimonadaceae bacterium]NUR20115.1 replicative DNA helicase [Gemmatimonadaceae bacterium]NUS97371.1 replicative DNA helicase [Gemmatimonadaceae bacterium]
MSSSPVEYSIAAPPLGRDPYRDRRPPYSEDAEQAVLAAMLMDADAVARVVETVTDDMFYREGHRRIFRAMTALSERGEIVDPLTLANELERRGELEASGGKDYIGFLVDAVPTSANVEYHARIVREKALYRRLIEVSTSIVSEAFEGRLPAAELLDDAEHKIFQVSQQRGSQGFTRIKELLWPTMERIEALQRGGKTVTGVPSGFKDLDEMTSGFQAADLVIVAARPSMGKTALTLNIAQHAAIEHNVPVAFFSLEMSKESLVQRMLTSEARIDAQRLRKGMLRDDDFPRLARAAGILSSAPVYIDDTPGITLLEMRSKARRLKADSGIGMVIVDYLQLMQGPPNIESRQQEVSQISRGLKALAKELSVPVVALSQLSRAPDQRAGDHRPQLSDLRESGAIEQDADLIMFIFRQEVYDGPTDKDGNSLEGRAEIIVGKQRNGPIGIVNVFFHKAYTRFENYTQREQT